METTTKTKLSLALLITVSLFFLPVLTLAVFDIDYGKLIIRDNKSLEVVRAESNVVSGSVKDIIDGHSISNVEVLFTDAYNLEEVYTANVDSNGNYQIELPAAGDYNITFNYQGGDYFDYNTEFVQINSFPFVYNGELLRDDDYSYEFDWDCSDDFTIQEGDFPLATYIDRYYEIIDKRLSVGSLTQEEWDELLALKYGDTNSIETELRAIENNPTNQEYIDNNYASVLLDKVLCNSRKEVAFYNLMLDSGQWPPEYPTQLTPHNYLHEGVYFSYDRGDFGLLDAINILLINNSSDVYAELLDSQAVQKIASIFVWLTENAEDEIKITMQKPWRYWDEYLDNHLSSEKYYWIDPSSAIYPNTQRRMLTFYLNGIDNMLEMLYNLSTENSAEMSSLIISNRIFEYIYTLMTLPSITDAAMPGYKIKVINRTEELLDEIYPYVIDQVDDIIVWNNNNKNKDDFFWVYLATPKIYARHADAMIGISNMFNSHCTNTSTPLNGMCSPIIPKYCDDFSIIDNCQRCGCPSGMKCKRDGACYIDVNLKEEF